MGDIALDIAADEKIEEKDVKERPVLKKESADLSTAKTSELISVEVPTITDYKRSENANGEAVLLGTINGEKIEQTLPTRGTGLLLFDPVSRNWAFLPVQIPAGWQFVELIEGSA